MITENDCIGVCHNETHVENRGEQIYLNTFEYKGCWNCCYFTRNKEFITVAGASQEYGVSESTIRNWCHKGKLDGKLCKKGRFDGGFVEGSPRIWIIKKEVKE